MEEEVALLLNTQQISSSGNQGPLSEDHFPLVNASDQSNRWNELFILREFIYFLSL